MCIRDRLTGCPTVHPRPKAGRSRLTGKAVMPGFGNQPASTSPSQPAITSEDQRRMRANLGQRDGADTVDGGDRKAPAIYGAAPIEHDATAVHR